MKNYQALRRAGHPRQWLVVGFWDHGYSQWDGRRTRYADIDYGGNSLFDFRTMYLQFFDTWLKGKQVGLEQTPKAHILRYWRE